MAITTMIYRVITAVFSALCVLSLSCGNKGGPSSPPGFYIDAVKGSDSNAGTAPSIPWQTLSKISSSTVTTATVIYLKRGSTWNEQLMVPVSGITIDAYGDATDPLPKIDGSRVIAGWMDQGGGLFSATVTLGTGEALGNISENGVMMSFLEWKGDAATTFAAAGTGAYSYAYPSTIYIKPAAPPAGKEYRASVKIYGITAVSRNDVAVKNIELTRFSLHGVHFQDCVRCSVSNAVITKGGGAVILTTPLLYAGNGVEIDNSSADIVVDNVAVSDIFDSGISPQTWVNNPAMSSISIRNSEIGPCGFAGIEVAVLDNFGTTNSSMTGVLISGVTVTGAGHGWSGRRYGTEGNGIRIKADNGAGSISGVQVDTTSVSGSIGDGVQLAGDIGTVSLHRMNIENNSCGIRLEEGIAASAKLRLTSSLVHHNTTNGISYNSPSAAGFELLQNTFSGNTLIGLAVFSHRGAAKIQNNIFYGSATHLYSASTLTNAVINNNCYNDRANMIGYNGIAYSTIAAFTAATALESNGSGGPVDMIDPAAGNFMLKSTSSCKALGDASAGVAADYSDYPFAAPPSSGAYQYR